MMEEMLVRNSYYEHQLVNMISGQMIHQLIIMGYGDEKTILKVITGDQMIYQLQQRIDSDHVLHDGMYLVHENGVNYLNIGVGVVMTVI